MLKWKEELKAMSIVTAVLGAFLFVSPWIFGFHGSYPANWSAWALGIASLAVAVVAWFEARQWERWVHAALGILMIISPWVLKFGEMQGATWTHVLIGLGTVVLAAVELWLMHADPGSHVTA